MMKITILVFVILILLHFMLARIYWDKEVLNRQAELLTVASELESLIQEKYLVIDSHKKSPVLSSDEKAQNIHSIIQPIFHNSSGRYYGKEMGYYDLDLDMISSTLSDSPLMPDHEGLSKDLKKSFHSGKPVFITDSHVVGWDGKGVIAVTLPVYVNDRIVGYVWAKISSSNIYYQSSLAYTKFLVLSIVIWLIIVILIKRNITRIGSALNHFAQLIIDNKLEQEQLEVFPELKPVLEKINNHMEHLQELNAKLESSNDKLITIMEGISDGFFAIDRKGKFTFVNEETKRIAQKENVDLLGKKIYEEFSQCLDEETLRCIQYAMAQRTTLFWESYNAFNNKHYSYHAYPFSQGVTVFMRDITDMIQREKELLRLERLNLIGQMAAGISHEVRNPMTTVRGFLQMLEGRSDSPLNKEYMDLMISEIDRANAIISDFLSLARVNSDSIKRENLNDIVERIFPMIQADAFNWNKDILLNLESIPDFECNESEIRQLILNLVRNGLEETPEGGVVTISTGISEDQIVLSIEDQGKGISPEIQERIGTPFITTKENGTGLGLAISIGIVHRHKGKLDFITSENGTTFYIYFPIKIRIIE